MLLDQEGEEHRKGTFIYDKTTPEECMRQVTKGEKNDGLGADKFIAHDELHPKYLKYNSLYFRVSDIKFTCTDLNM